MAWFGFSLRRDPARRIATNLPDEDTRGHATAATPRHVHQGVGWFDSSWDLATGLDVLEGLPIDPPLNLWLELCLAADTSISGAVAQRHEQPRPGLVPAPANRALGHPMELGDLGFAVAAEVAHLDQFGQFGIDGLELV